MKFFTLRLNLIIVITHICLSAFGLSAKFTYTKRSNCAPTIVEFTNNSTQGTGITYEWDFGLGAIVTTSDPTKKEQIYTKPGKYTVTLKVSDGVNTETTSTTITIAQGPKAGFETNISSGCIPLTVNYTSTSTQGDTAIASTNWDFRNGDFKSGPTVQYTYSKIGKFGILLKVTDKNGCSAFVETDSLIKVVNKPAVKFLASDTAACAPPLNVSFSNLSTGASALTYLWEYGNGKTSTEVSNSTIYESKGKYDVKLTATDLFGCSSSLEKKSYINVGNPTGEIYVLDSKKNTVTGTRLCSGTYTFGFSAGNLPVSTWTIVDNNKTTTITGTKTITYTVRDTGTIKVNLVYGTDLSCTDVIQKTFLKGNIKADFTADLSLFCSLPQQIKLTNTSVNSKSYSWFISGKAFSNAISPNYTVTTADVPEKTYKQLYNHEVDSVLLPIMLLVTNSDGCSDSLIRNTYLSTPVARFMPDKTSGCTPLQVTFSDSSRWSSKIDSYSYIIDGKTITSTDKTQSYTFDKPGIYSIKEIVKSGGCPDTSDIVKISVGTKLKPDFTVSPTEVCNGDKIRIIASSDNNAAIRSWRLKSPAIFDFKAYHKPDTSVTVDSDTAGLKSITLQVDYNGCLSDTTKKDIYKIVGPVGNFFESFSCDSALVYRFKSKITPASSLTWNIDTEVINDKDSVRHKFKNSGDYNVKLTAVDNLTSCTLSRTKTIKVRQIKANFALEDTVFCAGDSVKMDATSSADYINSCYNEGFLWYFGDDSPPRRVQTPKYSHVYSSKGKFKLLLITTADNGCIDSTKQYVYIKKPTATFTVDKYSGCVPNFLVNFTNTSTDNTIVNSVWEFGDKAVDYSQSKNVAHTYVSDKQKTFVPKLTVFDAYQCTGEYTWPITLHAVNSDFQADDNAICVGQKVIFTPVENNLDSVIWNFGEELPSKTINNHIYNNKGVFTPKLTAYKNGCNATVSKQNYISVEKADGAFWVSDSILKCYPDTIQFIHRNINGSPVVEHNWVINTNELTNDNDSVKYIFSRPGDYTAQHFVRTLNGCQANSSKTISISGPTAKFSFTPTKICYGETVNFQMTSPQDVTQWKWLFGDGNTSANNPVSHRYTSRGKLIPAITLINKDCNVTLTMDTLLVDQVRAAFIQKDSVAICFGNKVSFTNKSTSSEFWTWKINDVFKNNEQDLKDVLFTNKGQNTITLIASSDDCSDTLVRSYTVYANPAFKINGDSVLCKGQNSIQLSVNNLDGWKIKWSPTTGIDNSTAFTVAASPTATTTYLASVTDANGCSSTNSKKILINQLANYTRVPLADTTISIGDKINLSILTGSTDVNYSWSPQYNISCTDCNNPLVNPTKDASYTVQIKNTCVDFTEKFNIKVIYDFYLEAPSAFTPNGDSNNDVFRFEERNIGSFELKIFNRWGQLVFSTNDLNEGWDGTVNNRVQNADTYTYVVKAETVKGYKFEKSGNFLLLK